MNCNEVCADMRAQLNDAADSAVKEKVTRLTSGASCIGVTVPNIRAVAVSLKKKYALTLDNACDLLDAVCPQKCREEILCCIFVAGTFSKKKIAFPWERVEAWLPFLDNWETCDQLSSVIAAPLIHNNVGTMERLLDYTKAESLWIRRFAAATAANANHSGYSYPDETRAVCAALAANREPMVKKAVAWALRENGA